MRILHVNGCARRAGGAETYLADLVSAQGRRGDAVGLLATDGSTEFELQAFHTIGTRASAVGEFVTAFAPDVVHVHDDCLPPETEAGLRRQYPTVDFLHDFSFGCASGEHYFRGGAICERPHGRGCLINIVVRGCAHRADIRAPLRRYRNLSRRRAFLRDARAVVASEYLRTVAVLNGVEADRCHVVPYFADRPAAPPAPAAEGVIAFVGRVSSGKGLDVLLRALARIGGGWERLLVAGDGWALPACRRLATELGLGSKVTFLGWCGRDETSRVLERASIVVVPSRWPEPFGIVGIEAMAHARPVVASRVGGIPEWLGDGETGLLVEAGSESLLAVAIGRLLSDPASAEAMGKEAWRRVERFSLERHLGRLDGVYQAAVSGRRDAHGRTTEETLTASAHA